MDLNARISLDNSSLIAGLQAALVPLQQAIAGLQNLANAVQQFGSGSTAAASQVTRETAAIQSNTSAVAANTAAKNANVAAVGVGGGAAVSRGNNLLGSRYVRRLVFGLGVGVAGDVASGLMENAGMTRGTAATRVGADVTSGALMGGSMAGPWGAAIAGVIQGIRGVYREWNGWSKQAESHANALRHTLGEMQVAERAGNRDILREDSGDALKTRVEALQEAQRVLRDRLATGLVAPEDEAAMRAQEASLVRQIALARERIPIVEAAARREENAVTMAEARGRESRGNIGDMALPAVVDALRALETRMAASGYMNSDPEAVRRDASEASALRSRRDALERAQIKDAMQWLAKINSQGLSMNGANEYTKRGIGTGTAVGATMTGVERNTQMANQLLSRIAARLENSPAPVGVFA